MNIKWSSMNDTERELLSLQLVEMCNKLTKEKSDLMDERVDLKMEVSCLLLDKEILEEKISMMEVHQENLIDNLEETIEERSALIQSVRYLSLIVNVAQQNGGLAPYTVPSSIPTEKASIDKSLWT